MLNDAKWIGAKGGIVSPWKDGVWTKEKQDAFKEEAYIETNSLLFRKEFTLDKNIEHASLLISGLGFYEAFVNGEKPDEDRMFSPAISNYFELTKYDTYDVTALLKRGENVLGAEVAPGWFAPTPKYWGWQQTWYGNLRLIARLDVIYCDGSTETILSDETWKISKGAITESSIYDGETCDFRLLQEGWNNVGFDDSQWGNAEIQIPHTDKLQKSTMPPERIIRSIEPIKTIKLNDKQFVYDFGENGSGVSRVTVKGKAGAEVILNHSEHINEDGSLNQETNSIALNCDKFILADDSVKECMARFTFHGFRYIMVTMTEEMEIIKAEKLDIHNDLERTGSFICGNKDFNRLHQGYVRTQLACFHGAPIDCPQRQERKAWLGDAHVTVEMSLYNFDMRQFYKEFLNDMKEGRLKDEKCVPFICPGNNNEVTVVNDFKTSIDWNMAYPITLLEYYERYGDKDVVKDHYQALCEHTDYYVSICEDGFIPPAWFGDWISVDYGPCDVQRVAFEAGPMEHRQNPPFAATMFYCATLRRVVEIAKILGKNDDAEKYSNLLEISKKALCEKHYNSKEGIFGSGGQFLQAYVLNEHIVPEAERSLVFAGLEKALCEADYHIVCGIFGLRAMFEVLDEFKRYDIMYKIFTAQGYPGISHMFDDDRTTLPENPDGTGSGCHCMWASPDAALYKMFGGIRVNRKDEIFLTIKPNLIRELHFVKCRQSIDEGEVVSNWEIKGDEAVYHIVLPCRAKIELSDGEEMLLEAGSYDFKERL